jgi:hypothetical protein
LFSITTAAHGEGQQQEEPGPTYLSHIPDFTLKDVIGYKK